MNYGNDGPMRPLRAGNVTAPTRVGDVKPATHQTRFAAKYYGQTWCKEATSETKRIEYCTKSINEALNSGFKPKKIVLTATLSGVSFRHEKTDEQFMHIPLSDLVCFARHKELRHGKAKLISMMVAPRNPLDPELPYCCHMMQIPTTAEAEELCKHLSAICEEYAETQRSRKAYMSRTAPLPNNTTAEKRIPVGWS